MRNDMFASTCHSFCTSVPYIMCESRSRDGPKTYKNFMMALDEHVTPEAAQKQYDEYLTAYWGSKRRAVFQSEKEKPE